MWLKPQNWYESPQEGQTTCSGSQWRYLFNSLQFSFLFVFIPIFILGGEIPIIIIKNGRCWQQSLISLHYGTRAFVLKLKTKQATLNRKHIRVKTTQYWICSDSTLEESSPKHSARCLASVPSIGAHNRETTGCTYCREATELERKNITKTDFQLKVIRYLLR